MKSPWNIFNVLRTIHIFVVMGFCDFPKVNKTAGLILFIVNIIFPGTTCC